MREIELKGPNIKCRISMSKFCHVGEHGVKNENLVDDGSMGK